MTLSRSATNYDNETEAFIANIEETKKLIDKYELPILSVGRWNSEPIKDGKIDAAVKDMLKEQIDKADSLKEADYTAASWENMQKFLAKAKDVYNRSKGGPGCGQRRR